MFAVRELKFVHFPTKLLNPVQKGIANPEFMTQMALETIYHIPKDILQIYTNDSKNCQG